LGVQANHKLLKHVWRLGNLEELRFRARQRIHLLYDRHRLELPVLNLVSLSLPSGFDVQEKPRCLEKLNRQVHELEDEAQRIMQGRVHIFGADCHFDGQFPWKEDFTHGVRAQEGFWNDVQDLDSGSVGDAKVIWELNRLQFLLPVAKAFFLTGDSSCYDWLKKTIKGWDEANPYPMGINWASSLELAFRVTVLDWLIRFLGSALQEDEEFRHLLLRLLAIHGRHINRYLSTYFSPNTHLSGEALGLYLLGTRYPSLPGAGKWRETGRKILLDCLDAHVLPDGGYYERSLWYHRYTIEIYLLFAFLAQEAQDPLPDAVREKLGSLLNFMLHALRSDGTFPLIGDDDGGRFLALDDLDPSDARGLMAACAVLLGRGDLKAIAGDNTETVLWLWGQKGMEAYDQLDATLPRETGAVFPQTGYAFLRTGYEEDAVLVSMNAGPLGADNCGHGHADALSLTLSIGAQQIIVDPGTFSYSLDIRERNRFRGIEAHSSPCIPEAPQSIPSKSPFHWRRIHQDCRFTSSSVGWDLDLLSGACTDVASAKKPVSIARSIVLLKPKRLLFVWDRFTGPAGLSAVSRFMLHGREWEKASQGASSTFPGHAVHFRAVSDQPLNVELSSTEISGSYLQKSGGTCLSLARPGDLPGQTVTVVHWGSGDCEMTMDLVSTNCVSVRCAGQTVWCWLGLDGKLQDTGPLRTDAAAACLVQQDGRMAEAWALNVSRLSFSSETFFKGKDMHQRWSLV